MNENPELAKSTPKKQNAGMEALDWLYCIVVAVSVMIFLCAFVIRPISVQGSSMEQTLKENELVMINKLAKSFHYGDIVVLRKESFMTAPIIKRVIATEGQTIDIDFQEGVVYIDGAPLDEPYVNALTLDPEDFTEAVTVPEGCVFVTEAVTVPEGCVFVMGDNRNRSTDSRSARLGCVDERYIIGKVLFRFSPLNKFGRVA